MSVTMRLYVALKAKNYQLREYFVIRPRVCNVSVLVSMCVMYCMYVCVCVCMCVCRVFGGLTGAMDPGGMPAATLW